MPVTVLVRAAQGVAAFAVGARPRRCGSYPLMNLAEDFGVSYEDVLVLTLAVGEGAYRALPDGRRGQVEAASRRIWREIGDTASYTLYMRLKAVLGR